jgi:hypothetical protein
MLIKKKKDNFLSHFSAFLLIFLFFSFFPFEAISSFELWQKIQFQGKNIGYSVVRVKGDSVEEVMNMKLKAMGQGREVKAQLLWSKNPDYSFKTFEFQLKSEGNSVLVKGRVEGKNLSVQIGQSKKSFSIPEKVFTGSSFIFLISDKIKRGNQIRNFSLLYFDPSVLRLDILSFELRQKTRDYFVFKKTFAGISSFVYFDKNGNFLKEEGSMGISSVASSREDIISSPPEDVDIIFSTSVAVEGKYPESSQRRNIKRATLFVWGVDYIPSFPPRQVVSKEGYGFVVLLTDSPPSDNHSLELYTKPELLIESESQQIKKLARELKKKIESKGTTTSNNKSRRIFEKEGDRDNVVQTIQYVSDWVFRSLKKTSVLSMPSALQVLKTMKGDCNEHSILTVAILRALGIPSRVVFGLVYDSGSFFYHAWVEAFDGKNWIEFDPTWGLFPADILRIRIGTGNVSEWVKVLEYVGKIKIKFIDWQ